MPVMVLEQQIKKEIEENPVLEDLSDRGTIDDDENDNDNSADVNNRIDDSPGTSDNSEDSFDQKPDDLDKVDTDNEFSLEEYMGDDDDDTPSYNLYSNNFSKDDERKEIPYVSDVTLTDNLIEQINLRNLTDVEKIIAKNIIGNLDESGYLKRDLLSISDDLSFNDNITADVSEIENVLHEVQQLDPPGIAARNIQECLLLQLERMDDEEDVVIAHDILGKCLEEFTKKHYDKIISKLKITDLQLRSAENVILKLNPKPGGTVSVAETNANYIIPDFSVSLVGDELVLTLNSYNTPELRIKSSYQNMMKLYSNSSEKSKKDAAEYIKQKIDAAKLFIDSIQQRQKTLYNTMQAIINRQKDFLLTGDEMKLKPMILKDISQDINMDISTVSRVVNSKYVITPYGTYLLKYFFSESMSTESGEEVSNREIKLILSECVKNENKSKPLTDDELMSVLKGKGYSIARRTIAKYRQQLGIPVARLRKSI